MANFLLPPPSESLVGTQLHAPRCRPKTQAVFKILTHIQQEGFYLYHTSAVLIQRLHKDKLYKHILLLIDIVSATATIGLLKVIEYLVTVLSLLPDYSSHSYSGGASWCSG